MEKAIRLDHLTLGVCYYPEHWDESLWEEDLARMRSHGIEVIRVAEFAWSKFEPREGEFTFEFFDRFMALAQKHCMRVIFCTPTATPPAWLTEKYPEALNARVDGTLLRHGMRRHYNYHSPAYRALCARITQKLAEHYCPHPSVIGWQIDNELNCEINEFYSQSDHEAFRAYLKERFKTLDALNAAIGADFWNQTYTDWDEVFLRRPTISGFTNPHMALFEKLFVSQSAIGFCRLQADILKKFRREGQFITTNGIFGHLDTHEMTRENLDFIMYDSYPNFGYDLSSSSGGLRDRRWSRNLSLARSISPVFGVMEQQSGAGGSVNRMCQPTPEPGQMRLWTLQSIAHGADYVSYFRWRTCGFGTEIYWHGLLNYDNRDNRRIAELDQIHGDVQKLSAVCGQRFKAKVALLHDYANEWDGEEDIWHGPLRRFSNNGWFEACQKTHTPMDIVYLDAQPDLSAYALAVYPHPTILTDQTAELLEKYVRGGGTLILGARAGYKDEFGRCPMRPMPGPLRALAGAAVADFTAIKESAPVFWDGETIEASRFCDMLEAESAQVLGTYGDGWYKGMPALCKKQTGMGYTYYFGGGFSSDAAARFLKKLGATQPYADLFSLPEQVELAVRGDTAFLLNYVGESIRICLKKPMLSVLDEKTLEGEVRMSPYGVIVLRI